MEALAAFDEAVEMTEREVKDIYYAVDLAGWQLGKIGKMIESGEDFGDLLVQTTQMRHLVMHIEGRLEILKDTLRRRHLGDSWIWTAVLENGKKAAE